MNSSKKIQKWIKDNTVILMIKERQENQGGHCVGIRIKDGLVLTACHCLATISDQISCCDMNAQTYNNGQVKTYTTTAYLIKKSKNMCRYIPRDDCPDMALLEFADLPAIEPIHFGKPKLLEKVTIPVPMTHDGKLTYPLISQGQIACYDPSDDRMYIDAFILPGTSGAPVFNSRGQLIGLVTSLAYGNWALAYSSKTIRFFLSL